MINKKAELKQVFTRKAFIRYMGLLLVLPFAGIWAGMVRRHKQTSSGMQSRSIPMDMPQGVSFHGNLIVIREADEIRVLSARCTHLGCRIQGLDGGNLVCGCHGSRFSTEDGRVISGPARKPLQQLSYEIDIENDVLFVDTGG